MQVNIEYFGMPGSGKNVTEAKKDAGKRIEQALHGSYQPTMIHSRGYALVIWRDPHGWRSNIISMNGEFRADAFQCYSSGSSYEDELFSAMLSLAQFSWDGSEEIPPCLANLPATKTGKGDLGKRLLSEFRSWRAFQLAYKHAKVNNLAEGDNNLHRWACDHAHEFQQVA